ncbi:MAG: hypothetical protein KDI46_02595 [Alphaproteobacteria bacterium]|nr:hypothetical protein [Alphaproteobacteria bacterium]
MTIWIALWLLISLIILFFLGWSVLIVQRQKHTWKAFAAKYKLRYKANKFMLSPDMDGVLDEYKMSFFASEHFVVNARTPRSMTAVEVILHSTLPVDLSVASGGMVPVVKNLEFTAEIRPDHERWDKSYIALSGNKAVLRAYLTPERLKVLTSLMRIKNSWLIFIYRKDTMLLRVDLPDPLMNPEKLEKLKNMLLVAAKTLELQKGESKMLKTEETKASAQGVELEVDDGFLAKGAALRLEDEEDGAIADSDEEIKAPQPSEDEEKERASQKPSSSKSSARKSPKKKS